MCLCARDGTKRQPHACNIQATATGNSDRRRNRQTLSCCRVEAWSNHMNAISQKKVATDLHCCANKCYHGLVKKSQTYQEVNVSSGSSFNLLSSFSGNPSYAASVNAMAPSGEQYPKHFHSARWRFRPNSVKINSRSQ